LLFKVLADDAGLKAALVRGNYAKGGTNGFAHAWNEVVLDDGRRLLVDVMHHGSKPVFPEITAGYVVQHYLKENKLPMAEGAQLVDILLNSFIDARLFGSAFAFKESGVNKDETDDSEASESTSDASESKAKKGSKADKWDPKPHPKTLTGAVQINHGEVLHDAEAVDIHGTSLFGSQESKTQGTFTTYFGLRYALIGFNGIANEHSAQLSHLTETDYNEFLAALWKSVRSAGNTRTKVGQVPRLLLSIEYQDQCEFQFGCLLDYVKLEAVNGKLEKEWAGPSDYRVNLSKAIERFNHYQHKIKSISYDVSPDLTFTSDSELPKEWKRLEFDGAPAIQ
jgi:CRISPR-associated protein Csh2